MRQSEWFTLFLMPVDETTSSGSGQVPFQLAANELAENPENRCPCILLLDVSGSMQGEPIKQLQEGVVTYRDSIFSDDLAKKRVEVAIVTFGGTVDVVQSFVTTDRFTPPPLQARGDTPMGEAVVTALRTLAERKGDYRNAGIKYYRPWVFLITDGGPTDESKPCWAEAKEQIRRGESEKQFSFFSVGVEGANMEKLTELNPARAPLKLNGLGFKAMFQWLSSSQGAVSRSAPGQAVPLSDPTTGPTGWATV